ncbi:hypothetical protein HYU91_02490 [Candidatus Collierbacteria bacterium]|nr:hypothetical protein [Candidatus Collierbacteria bacterium]
MLRINIYIPEDLNHQLGLVARSIGQKKAEVFRTAIRAGLKTIQPKSISALNLVNFAKEAEKIPTKGRIPKDIIKNLDYYTWGGKKRD